MRKKLKIIIIGPENNLHIKRWIEYCQKLGINISIIERFKWQSLNNVKEIRLPQPCPEYTKGEIKEELEIIKNVPDELYKDKIRFACRVKTYRDIIKKERPDIVHSHWAYDHGLYGALGAKKICPFVQTVLGSDVFLAPFVDVNKFKELTFIINEASCVLGNSRSMVNMAQSLVDWKRKNSFVFKWGIAKEFNKERYNRDTLRKKYGYKKDDVLMLSIRGFEPVYNLRTVVKAYDTVKKHFPHLKLILAGKNYGWESRSWNIKSENGIKVMDYKEHKKIAELMAISDISISLPYSDSMSNSTAESMAMGLFVITSDLWPIKEHVKHMKNGLIVNPSNINEVISAIESYFEKPKLRKTFENANKKIVKKEFSETRSLELIEEIYSSILSR